MEIAQSSDEPTSYGLEPAATLPRLEFVSEAQLAAASKLLDMGGTGAACGAGGAATHARLASLPQPSFRLARVALRTPGHGRATAPPWLPGPMAMDCGKPRGLLGAAAVVLHFISARPHLSCVDAVSWQVRQSRGHHCGRRARVQCLFACGSCLTAGRKQF